MSIADLSTRIDFPKPLSIDEGTYYRSRIHTFETGTNPLIAVSQPLFALLNRLPYQTHHLNYTHFIDQLTHELKTFAVRSISLRLPKKTIIQAQYLLCTAIDKVIKTHTRSKTKEFPTLVSLFFPSCQDESDCFELLNELMSQPKAQLDLLEFATLCLQSAFITPSQAHVPKMETILDKMIQTIENTRHQKKQALFVTPKIARDEQRQQFKPLKILAGTTIGLLLVAYIGFNYTLHVNSQVFPDVLTSLIHER